MKFIVEQHPVDTVRVRTRFAYWPKYCWNGGKPLWIWLEKYESWEVWREEQWNSRVFPRGTEFC
jgi:hypothetical protein